MPATIRFPIAAKFGVMLAVLVAALAAVGFAGMSGLSRLNSRVHGLYADHIVTLQRTTQFAEASSRVERVALQLILSTDPADIARLERELATELIPRTTIDLEALRAAHAGDTGSERAPIEGLLRDWRSFLALHATTALGAVVSGPTAAEKDAQLAGRVRSIFEPIERVTSQATAKEDAQSAVLARQAQTGYGSSRTLVLLISAVAIVLGGVMTALLTRAIVPRIRRYSAFAVRVAQGAVSKAVDVSGNDELGDLGVALNEMVRRRVDERGLEHAQAEFAEVMQVTESEDEAHELLKRQIERLIPDCRVVAFNRNNSADRLQPTTEIPAGSPLAERIEDAKPRSCLAVRFAKTHTERADEQTLVGCEVCGRTAPFTTCEPLLVGGEVIGAVLASHESELSPADEHTIKQSVAQAAPVLGNLRNLAIAELRAATDALTGLPNNRNVADTVKRMVAQAARTVSPLAALALDLDHFKQINDGYGHGVGDEVLATVASALVGAVRESDFVGRAGGEEFVILLPDTALPQAEIAAEKLRAAVESITVAAVERPITASIGVAIVPDHAGDAATLLRHADRALYAAKRNGRNRTEVFTPGMLPGETAAVDGRPASPQTPRRLAARGRARAAGATPAER